MVFKKEENAKVVNREITEEEYPTQLRNFAKIYALIEKSDSYHKMMIQNANDILLTQQRMIKLQTLAKKVTL